MRSKRVAAAADAAALPVAGLPRNLQQAMQWLQHIKDTPIESLDNVWMLRALSISECLNHYWQLHATGKLPPAMQQQLPPVLQLLGATIIQLLKQAPAVAVKPQQLAGQARKADIGSSSCRSSSAIALLERLRDVVNYLDAALNDCFLCLETSLDSAVRVYKDIGYVQEVSAAVQWAAAQLQHESAATPWHTCMRKLGKNILSLSCLCFNLFRDLGMQPGYQQLVLSAAKLAWVLLHFEQQAEAAGSSSTGSSSRVDSIGAVSARASRRQQQQMQQMQPIEGMPGTVLEFLHQFGEAVYVGLGGGLTPAVYQLGSSEELIQLLLAYTALSIGAAHKRVVADASRASKRSRSSSSRGSSKRSDQHCSAAAAADVPASHLDLLAALSPPLRKQLSRQYVSMPDAGDYGSFSRNRVEEVVHIAPLVLTGLYAVLILREQLLHHGRLPRFDRMAAVAVADQSTNFGSSSSRSTASESSPGSTLLPREQELLLPLLLTLVEYMLLLPDRNQTVLPLVLQPMVVLCKQLKRNKSSCSSAAAAGAAGAAENALADALIGPVLLQVGPAVLQYLRGPDVVREALQGGERAAAVMADREAPAHLITLVMKVLKTARPEAFAAAWQQDPSALEQVLQATLRITADDCYQTITGLAKFTAEAVRLVTAAMQGLNRPAAVAAAAAAAGMVPAASSDASLRRNSTDRQQQQQQQPSRCRTGLLLSSFKALTKGMEKHSTRPLSALVAVCRLACVCPGLATLARSGAASWYSADSSTGAAAAAAAVGATSAASASQQPPTVMTTLLDSALAFVMPSDTAMQASSSSSSSSSIEASAAAMGEHAGLLALLIGRALRVAALALQQLHEAGSSTSADSVAAQLLWFDDDCYASKRGAQLKALSFIGVLYLYMAALSPLLEQQQVAAAAAAAAAGSSAGGSNRAAGCVPAGSRAAVTQDIAALQQLQLQLLHSTWVGMADVMSSADAAPAAAAGLTCSERASMMQAAFVHVFPADAAQQMLQLANGVCAQFVSAKIAPLCCANPGCTKCSRLSEQELVSGKSTVCSGCRMVRLCSAECNAAFWKAGHKQVCKRLKGSKQLQRAADDVKGSSSADRTGGSSRSRTPARSSRSSSGTATELANSSSSSMRSSSAGGSQGSSARSSSSGEAKDSPVAGGGSSSAAAVLELPGNAAAAAALSVRQLKALLAGLGVCCVAAVEKSDLVGTVVAHLGLV